MVSPKSVEIVDPGSYCSQSKRFFCDFVLSSIGVGAGKFLGCEGFLPEFPQTYPKSFCEIFAYKFSLQWSWRPIFGMTSKQRYSRVFLHTLCAIFWNQTRLGAIFARLLELCPDFQGFCSDFQELYPDFRQIKTFGDGIAPPAPPPPAPVLPRTRTRCPFLPFIVSDARQSLSATAQLRKQFQIQPDLKTWTLP